MNKRYFLCFFFTLFLFISIVFASFNIFANFKVLADTYTPGLSPEQQSYQLQNMFDGTTTQVLKYFGSARANDRNIEFVCDFQGDDMSKDKLFAVLIDRGKGPVAFSFLNLNPDNGWYYTNLMAPYYCDMYQVHIYKQTPGDPDFLLHEENFVCKTRNLFMSSNIVMYKKAYLRALTKLDGNGNVLNPSAAKQFFVSCYTPNYYRIEAPDLELPDAPLDKFGVLVFPQGQENLLSYEDRVVPQTEETIDVGGEELYGHERFNFWVPPEVKEFEFHVYKGSLLSENFLYKYKIKLDAA